MANTAPAAELIAEDFKRDRKGRHITPPQRRAELVAAYRGSGMTMIQFARREGINPLTLAKWSAQVGKPKPVRFAEVKLTLPTVVWAYEMTLPNGIAVRAASAVFAIRPSAIGKKNYLFIGHPDAGQRTAIIYSIVVSCQRRKIDPLAYLRDVLTRLPGMTTRDNLDALTPANWTPA